MTAAMDEAVGEIISAVEARNWRANTLVLFSSDNGGPNPGNLTSNGPLRAGKGTLYEGGVRVCAFANWPGQIRSNTIVNAPMHIVDWYPTLLKLAGARLNQDLPLDGRDCWPAITQGRPSPHTEILLNTTPRSGAIRVGDWKLVLNGNRPNADEPANDGGDRAPEQIELFNLVEDLSEKTNLAGKYPDKARELRTRYDSLASQQVPPKNRPKSPDFRSPKIWGERE
jgi:arylsulfatase A-like enzyme